MRAVSRCLGIRQGPNTDFTVERAVFRPGSWEIGLLSLIPAVSLFFRPGSGTRWKRGQVRAARPRRGDEPRKAGLSDSSVLARMPEPGGAEEPEAPAAGPDRDSGPGSRAALSLPQRAEAQPRGSGAGGPETWWTFLDRPYTRPRS